MLSNGMKRIILSNQDSQESPLPALSLFLPLVPRAPLIFALAKWMQQLNLRGRYHLQRFSVNRAG